MSADIKEKNRKKLPLAVVFLLDILIAGIVLLVFAWFHHAGSYVMAKYESRNSVPAMSCTRSGAVSASLPYFDDADVGGAFLDMEREAGAK